MITNENPACLIIRSANLPVEIGRVWCFSYMILSAIDGYWNGFWMNNNQYQRDMSPGFLNCSQKNTGLYLFNKQ
jgi:hypothetical protein